MKVTGYQLMDRIEALREEAQTINGQFTGSLFRFANPTEENLTQLSQGPNLPMSVILFNIVATAVSAVGVFASLYAGCLLPSLRLTAGSLVGVINGLSMILLTVFIDPYLSILSDDVLEGKVGEPYFRKAVVWMVGSRMAGTVLAQAMLIPAAYLICGIAARI